MANSLEDLARESVERTSEPRREPPVLSSKWLDRAIAWVEYSSHKPWCNVAPGNIYASDGDPCDCGREELLKDLKAARSNVESSNTARTKKD